MFTFITSFSICAIYTNRQTTSIHSVTLKIQALVTTLVLTVFIIRSDTFCNSEQHICMTPRFHMKVKLNKERNLK